MSFNYPAEIPQPGANLFMSSSSHLPADSTSPIFNTSGVGNLNTFTADDRMLLLTLYHQQQIIQIQLNRLMPCMQDMKKTLNEMSQLWPYRSRDSHEQKEEKTTEPPSSAPAPVKAKPTTAPIPVDTSSAEAETKHAKVGSSRVATTTAEEFRSCTPPGEVSGYQSTMNRSTNMNNSVDSVAAPWDPSTGAPHCRANSLSSTVGSQLSRSNNPLLVSRYARTAPMAHGTAPGTQQPSRLHTLHSTASEAGGGHKAADPPDPPPANTSAAGYVPPTITPPRVSSITPSLDREIPPYRHVTGGGRASQIDLESTSGLLKRGFPAVTRASGDVTKRKEPVRRATTSASPQHLSKPMERILEDTSSVSAPKSSASQGTHTFFVEKKDPHPNLNTKDDSFSEGYASHETQEYLREMGFLQRHYCH